MFPRWKGWRAHETTITFIGFLVIGILFLVTLGFTIGWLRSGGCYETEPRSQRVRNKSRNGAGNPQGDAV